MDQAGPNWNMIMCVEIAARPRWQNTMSVGIIISRYLPAGEYHERLQLLYLVKAVSKMACPHHPESPGKW